MKTLLSLLVLLGVASVAMSLKCFVCNSHNDKECYDMPETAKSRFLSECNVGDDKKNYTLCRKLHIYLDQDFGEQHPAEDRVHRACGFVEDNDNMGKKRGDCYYKSGYNTRSWVCSCDQDQCNGALPTASVPLTTLLLPALALLVTSMRAATAV